MRKIGTKINHFLSRQERGRPMKRKAVLHVVLFAVSIFFLMEITAFADAPVRTLTVTIMPEDISDYGNVTIHVSREEMMDAGYSFGDIVTAEFSGQAVDMPFGSSYSDVDTGSPVLVCRDQDDSAKMIINMGDFAAEYGLAFRDEEQEERQYPDDVIWPVSVTISLKEAGGYYEEYVMHRLSYTNERSDYPDLTDEQFGNFREITTTGMGEGVLYRCSSPINPSIRRSIFVDRALEDAGVTVIMNLSDTVEEAESFEGYEDSYYAAVDYIALDCGMDVTAGSFREKLKEGLLFFADNPGIYAVHCLEGKDRTGIVSALLECFMGAGLEEVVDDYMITYNNYYGVTRDDIRYETIAGSNICRSLQNLFDVSDLEAADLSSCAEKYLTGIGLDPEDLAALRENLSADAAEALRPAA